MYAESAIYYPTGGNWGPYGAAYLPYVPYQDGANTLDATWSATGLTDSFSVIAVSPAPGHYAAPNVDLFAHITFPD